MHRLLLAACVAVAPGAAFAQAARDNIDALIEQQARANGVPASFVHAVVKRESNYNPNAKGGSALGLMQIKHATARSLGYTGDAAGLYDPATNLRFGVAYLAGAYRTAQGNLSQAYQYYNRGYYYAAKRQGVSSEVAAVVAPVAASASAVASLFNFGGGTPDAGSAAALAYAPAAAAASLTAAPTEMVEVPLPPRRPAALGGTVEVARLPGEPAAEPAAAASAASVQAVEVPLPPRRPSGLGGAVQVAEAAPAPLSDLRLAPQAAAEPAAARPVVMPAMMVAAMASMTPALTPASTPAATPAAASAAPAAAAAVEAVTVPLPPRRPSVQRLAAATPRRTAPAGTLQEAAALPAE